MLQKVFKTIGLLSMTGSYVVLIWNIIEHDFPLEFTQLLHIAWIFGVISLITNAVYAILINLDQWLFSLFGISGLIWLVPFFINIDNGFGFPSLIVYLIIGIYLHFKKAVK